MLHWRHLNAAFLPQPRLVCIVAMIKPRLFKSKPNNAVYLPATVSSYVQQTWEMERLNCGVSPGACFKKKKKKGWLVENRNILLFQGELEGKARCCDRLHCICFAFDRRPDGKASFTATSISLFPCCGITVWLLLWFSVITLRYLFNSNLQSVSILL